MTMAHIDTLKAIFEAKRMTYTEIGKKIGKHSSTIKEKFESNNTNTLIDFLNALGLRIIDDNGEDIVTGQKYTLIDNNEMVQIGNLLVPREDIEKLKNELLK